MDTVKLTIGGAAGDLDADDYELFRRVMGERHKSLKQTLSAPEIQALKAKGSWEKLKRAFNEGRDAQELDKDDQALLRRALASKNKALEHILSDADVTKLRDKGTIDKFREAVEKDGDISGTLDKEDRALLRKALADKYRPIEQVLTADELAHLKEKGSLKDFRRAFTKSKTVNELEPADQELLFKVMEAGQRRMEDILTPAEIERLKEKKLYDRFNRARQMNTMWRMFNLTRGAFQRVVTPKPAKEGFWKRTLDLWHDALHLLPYGIPNVRQMRANFIFWKVAMNHEYKLKDSEIAFVKRFPNLEKKLEDYRKEVSRHPWRYKLLSTWHNAQDALMRVLGAAVAGSIGIDVLTTQYLTTQDSLDPTHPDGMREDENATEVMFVYPMWGPAIRVGNAVYFYSPRGVVKLTLNQWREMLTKASDKNSNFFMANHHTRVELKLNGKERAELMALVEEDVQRGGSPVTFMNRNSIRRINTAVAEVTGMKQPPLVNRTRYLSTIMYRMSGFFGTDKVGKIVYAHDDKSVIVAKGKDFTLDVMEALGFLRSNKAMNYVTGELRDEAIEKLIQEVTNPGAMPKGGPDPGDAVEPKGPGGPPESEPK